MGALASGIETLILARAVQAAGGGTCFALARAVVRDAYPADEAASMIPKDKLICALLNKSRDVTFASASD